MSKPTTTAADLAKKLQYERAIERMTSKEPFVVEHTINLDWFEAMASGAFINGDDVKERYEFDNGRIVLARKGTGTKIFKYGFEIYLDGKLFGKCHCSPRAAEILKPDYIQFQVQNNVLYEDGGFSDIKYFFAKMSWKLVNLTRFDIALDGVDVMDLVEQYLQKKIDRLGRAKLNAHIEGKHTITGFDIGRSKGWNKMCTGYIKTKELEKSNKNYIKDFWKRTGLQTEGREIQRLEMKIKNEEVKKIVDFEWRDLDNFEYLATIFRTCMKNFFEFIEIGSDSNVTRAKRIEFINWDFLGALLLPRLSTKESNEVYRMKQGAKTNFWCYLASGFDEITGEPKGKHYAQMAQEMAANVNCLDWFANKLDLWKDEFYKKCGYVDGVIQFQYLLHFEQYEDNTQLQLFEKHVPGKM